MITTKLYLDTRGVKPGNPAPLKVAVTKKGATAYIKLDISLLPSQWDKNTQRVVNHPRRQFYNTYINKRKVDIDEIIIKMEAEGDVFGSITEIKKRIVDILSPKEVADERPKDLFMDWLDRFVSTKTGRTKELYEITKRRIEAFEPHADSLRFVDMNVDWLSRFDVFMAKTAPAKNARNIHFRNIRTIFNYAIDNDVPAPYPFRKFKLINEPTRKRSMKVEVLRKIFDADLDPWQERYRDMFKLSFFLIGINVVDLCGLSEIVDGRVEYNRAKTHKPYSIKVEPEAMEIIECYKGKRQLLNYVDTVKEYRSFYKRARLGLNSIKESLNAIDDGIEIKELTTYWARHSWATIAASLDIPKDTISAALGHSMGSSITSIYIDYDMRKVDDANRKVIDWVLYGKR